jgi:hypothetical protein
MPAQDLDIVHTITDWYDGARAGVAGLSGKPHYYECQFDKSKDDWSDIYLLKPLDEETFRLAMEDWGIWLRCEAAFHEGRTPLETHPALPEDRVRHDGLAKVLGERLVVGPDTCIKAKGDFKYGEPTLVRWYVVP